MSAQTVTGFDEDDEGGPGARLKKGRARGRGSDFQPERSCLMANREQKGNREKRKPKKEKPKAGPVLSSFGAQSNKPAGKAK